MDTQPKQYFLGLAWKYSILIAIVLILLNIGISWTIYNNNQQEFVQQLKETQDKNQNTLQTLIQNSINTLQQVADTIHLMANHKEALPDITTLFNNYWFKWQFTWGLYNAAYFNPQSRLIQSWGTPLEKQEIADLTTAVYYTLQQEIPQTKILCYQNCYLYTMTPLLIDTHLSGVLVLSYSLADMLIQFKNISNSDLGILHALSTQKNTVFNLSAITDADKNTRLIQTFLQQHHIPNVSPYSNFRSALPSNQQYNKLQWLQSLIREGHIYTQQNKRYYIHLYPIQKNRLHNYFIIINDITIHYQALQDRLKTIISFSIGSLIIIAGLLFFILKYFIRRLQRLSYALPLLAKYQYHEIRTILNNLKSRGIFYDEIDHLIDTSNTLTQQLEEMEAKEEQQTLLLKQKSLALQHEKEFIQTLFDTAPLLIITQDIHGTILSHNAHVSQLLDLPLHGLAGELFDTILSSSDSSHIEQLQRMRTHQLYSLSDCDDILRINHRKQYYISWMHSLIQTNTDEHNNKTMILSIGVNITERKSAEEQLLWTAIHDQLTHLHNRYYFNHELEKMINHAKRYNKQISLLYLDLDQFKIINDTEGHSVGDKLLSEVANVLSKVIRQTDTLCRIGGDEFAIISYDVSIPGITSLAKRINKELKHIRFNANLIQQYKVSISIGIAIYPQHGTTFKELLANADLAMYKAKSSGFGNYHIFDTLFNYNQEIQDNLYWKNLIEEALQKDWLHLYYQPILAIQTNTISHYECLLRIIDDKGKIIMPFEFIHHAEKLRLIAKVEKSILNLAIQKHIFLQQQQVNFKLAINLSGRSINDKNITQEIKRLLQLPAVSPENIIFEITETHAVFNFDDAQIFIAEVKRLGCHFALDDFGAGYSSFSYLKNLAVDYIKIDGSFIKHLDTNKADQILVRAITNISHELGKHIIAEFVENQDILDLLQQFSVNYAQGYHISKPLPDIPLPNTILL